MRLVKRSKGLLLQRPYLNYPRQSPFSFHHIPPPQALKTLRLPTRNQQRPLTPPILILILRRRRRLRLLLSLDRLKFRRHGE